jgi:hypothetical protein
MAINQPVIKPKDYKYKIGDPVVINNKAKKDLPNDVGKIGYISGYAATSPNYDYFIEVHLESRKVKESEINSISSPEIYQKGDVVVNLINNEICTVDEFYEASKEVRVLYSDSTAGTTHISNIRKVMEDEETKEDAEDNTQPENAVNRLVTLLLTKYKNEDNTYTLPNDVLHKLIEYSLVGEKH